MKEILFITDTLTFNKTVNDDKILKFTNEDNKDKIPSSLITAITICLKDVESYWIEEKEAYVPSLSNTDTNDVEPATLLICISVGGILYKFTNNTYTIIKSILENFEYHYLKESIRAYQGMDY